MLARSIVFTTLTPGATAAQIVSAMNACPAGQVVQLAAGTYNITGIELVNCHNKTLRGAGPNLTTLVFQSGGGIAGFGRAANLYIRNNNSNFAMNPTTWSAQEPTPGAPYIKGTSQITATAIANLFVGSLMILDQLDDPDIDNGSIWMSRHIDVSSTEDDFSTGRTDRGQNQIVRVTNINGNVISFSAGLYMPNWRAARTPGAYWSSGLPVKGVGIENLTLDHSATTTENGITLFNGDSCWFRNVRSIRSNRAHLLLFQSKNITLADSYFFGTQAAASQSYGVEFYVSADCRIENNIFNQITAPIMMGGGSAGNVVLYNYMFDDFTLQASGAWMQAGLYHHNIGVNFALFEGNDAPGFTADNIHGTSHFATVFRCRLAGWEINKTLQTTPVHIYALNRYFNIIGCVLGQPIYHTNYQRLAPNASGIDDLSIFVVGWPGDGGHLNSLHPLLVSDPLAHQTLMRWGNYDTVGGVDRFNASEVPSSIALYPNPVPPSILFTPMEASLYHTARPTYFDTIYGSVPWPPIGPDVVNGNINGLNGRAWKIPARLAFENMSQVNFNADDVLAPAAIPTIVPIVGNGVVTNAAHVLGG